MDEIVKLDSAATYNSIRGVKTLHPLVTVLDLSRATPMPAQTFNVGLYAVYLKELNCGELKYGRCYYPRLFNQKAGVSPNEYRALY